MLGALDLKGTDGRAVHSILAQPKRLALLAYLAVHTDHGARRDSVVALFWPELDTPHARGALRQSLRFLRRELGDGILNGQSDEAIGFEPGTVWCDVAAFEQACKGGQPARALELYRGEFLDGCYVSGGSPELDRWIAAERTRLGQLAVRAAADWAGHAEREGDLPTAVHAARLAIALDPDDERALARLIELLDRSGDRAGALSAFETFRRHLQKEYDATPSPETAARIRSIRDRTISLSPAAPVEDRGAKPTATLAPHGGHRRWWKVAAIIGLVGGTATAALVSRAPTPVPMNPQLVAVLPFRVTGADSSLRHLSEGMVELMALELTGAGGPQAIPPASLLEVWHRSVPPSREELTPRAAVTIARRLGAGRILDGAIVGTRERLTITVTLLSPEDSRDGIHANVTGPYDSLRALVDQLTAQLLTGEAGTSEPKLAALTSLPALRAYLDGRAAFRRGQHVEAVRRFAAAVQADSTFAPAALGLRSASRWTNGVDAARAERLAWAFRERLSPFDRAYLVAEIGPHYPAPYSASERIAAWEDVLERYPEMAEGWHRLGDLYFHAGAMVGIEAPLERARSAFQRALALDSTVGSEGLSHLIEIAAFQRDTVALRPLLAASFAMDPTPERAEGHQWLAAFTARDLDALAGFRVRFRTLRSGTLAKVWAMSQQTGFDVSDAVQAEEALAARVDPTLNPGDVLTSVYELALNRGRPHEAQSVAMAMSPGWSNADRLAVVVLSSLYGRGDSIAAAAAIPILESLADAPFALGAKRRHDQYEYVCVVGQWHVAHHTFAHLPAAIAKLRVPDATAPPWLAAENVTCGAALEAAVAASHARPEASALLERLDSMVQAGPDWRWSFPRHRLLARLWEDR
ncbi:MAG TPA: BTAD domain-containing putative transcriptional regulator, partial [Gemmatimonadales bacterium]|nr:BTAD domain-containing putative transcriptional regulator [Gemmatimonadales bacterium]